MKLPWQQERRSEQRASARQRSKRNVLEKVNKELWLLLSLFVIAGLLNFLVAS
ncbi:MAG TPA: hypothetical protein VNN18_07285 [Candidatus Xenobia bacterium]|nr:hypothetical protein [Candidatus Xenobia bacterium]